MQGSALWTAAVLAAGTMARVQAGAEPSPPGPQPGEAVKGLTLTLSATPASTTIDRDGRTIKPVALTFTFSAQEVTRRNAYDLVWIRLTLQVTGPDETSAETQPLPVDRQMRAPVPADFPTIGPAKAWTHTHPTFPGEFGGRLISLRRAGAFRIRAVYRCLPDERVVDHPLAADCWTGTVVSNEITLTVTDGAGGGERRAPQPSHP